MWVVRHGKLEQLEPASEERELSRFRALSRRKRRVGRCRQYAEHSDKAALAAGGLLLLLLFFFWLWGAGQAAHCPSLEELG